MNLKLSNLIMLFFLLPVMLSAQPKGSYSVQFDGSNDYLNGGMSTLQTSTLTVEFWVNLQAYGGTYFTKISGSDNGLALEVGNGSNIVLSVGYDGGRDIQTISASTSLNTWHHIAVRFDNGTATVFLDGSAKGNAYGTSQINVNAPFIFGSFMGGGYNMNGKMDDIKIFTTARSDAEILSDMNYGNSDEPTAFWAFYEGYGDNTYDVTGNGNVLFFGATENSADSSDPVWISAQSLVAEYNFSGNVNDNSGNELHGTQNGGFFTKDRFGNADQAYLLDGEDDHINLGANLLFDFTNAITISLWVKGNSGEPYAALIRKGQYTWSMNRSNQTDNIRFGADGLNVDLVSEATVFDGKWHHIVGTYDGSNIRLYVDGVLDSESAATGTIIVEESDVWIGGNSEDQNFGNFGGVIDDIKLYNYAIDATDAEQLFQSNNWPFFNATEVFFGYTENDELQSLTLYRNDQPGIYYSFSAFTDFQNVQNGRFVFNTTELAYGDNEGDFVADEDGEAIQVGSGPHVIRFRPQAGTYDIESIETIGLVGTATPNGWTGPDIEFNYNGNGVYTLYNVFLTDGQFKFRANNVWSSNWGYYPYNPDTLIDSGENIDVSEGVYNIALDLNSRTYTISPIVGFYRLGSPNATLNTSSWSLEDEALSKFRNAISDPGNFGSGGIVETPVVVDMLSEITPAKLSTLHGFFEPYWNDEESTEYTSDIIDAFHNGMDLWLLEDDNSYNNIGEMLGLVSSSGSGTPSSGDSPFFSGPFGNTSGVFSYGDFNMLDSATVISLGGTIGAKNESGEVTIAYWPKGAFSEGSGALVIFTDVDMLSNYFNDPFTAELQPNAIMALNTMAWLVGQNPSLPVELSDFTAQFDQKRISLNWTTVTESNNAGWEVEVSGTPLNPPLIKGETPENSSNLTPSSSKGAGGFSKIGFIAGKGTTTEKQSYAFQVESSRFQVQSLQFRLKQIDLDGKFTYSDILTVDVTPNSFGLSQNYPNPFNPATVISYKLQVSSPVRLVVFDLLGREVATLVNEKKEAGNYRVNFDGSHLTSGVYFYKISAGNFSDIKKMMLVK